MKIKYKDCTKIKPYRCTCWLIKYENGEKEIAIWNKKAKIEDIINYIKIRNTGLKFTVMNIDVGLFNIKEIDHYYSSDARVLNQNKTLVTLDKNWQFNEKKKIKIKRRKTKDIPF